MYCRQCGKEIHNGDSFCANCGTEVKLDKPIENKAGAEGDSATTLPVMPRRQSTVRKTSGWAISSLILGILAFVFLPVLGAILAIIFSVIAKRDIRESGGKLVGSGIATAGLVLGIIGLVVPVVILIVAVPVFHAFILPHFKARYNIVKGVEAVHAYYIDNGKSYQGLNAGELIEIDGETRYSDSSGDESGVIYVEVIDDDTVRLSTYSKTGEKYTATAAGDDWDFNFAMTDDEYEFWKEFKNWYPFD